MHPVLPPPPMPHALRCLFIVQGEGRGHMTQAMALQTILQDAGHSVVGVLVGRNPNRSVPGFFREAFDTSLTSFQSPTFVSSPDEKAVQLGPTLWSAVRHLGTYRDSLRTIDQQVRTLQPDVILNFFEPLAGVYHALYPSTPPMVCVGHQYLFHHPVYPFPEGRVQERWAAQRFTDLTAAGGAHRLALSFYPAPNLPDRNLTVVPPLLRRSVTERPVRPAKDHLLIYVLNRGYGDDIIRWHRANPEIRLCCFWDNPGVPDPYQPHPTLTFHQLHAEHFIEQMATARGVVCTAGFESVCEAMYLGKPVLMVPVQGHFEQLCNALDAQATGAGLHSPRFDLHRLLDFLPHYQDPSAAFRTWADTAASRILPVIEQVAYRTSVAA